MKRLGFLLIGLTTLLLTSTFAGATEISGSLPFVFLNVDSNGTNLATTTLLTATQSITESPGTQHFKVIPPLTDFGPMVLHESTITTGGGFMVSNATWGSFTATSASLITRIPTFLNIDMFGTFDPGPGFAGFTATPAVAHVTFNQTGPALSGAFTLETRPVPEPSYLGLAGCGLLFGVTAIRKKLLC